MERLAVAMFPDRALEKLWFVHKSHPVRIEVPCDQFELAEEMLIESDARGSLPDAIHCPECKSLRVQYPQFAHKSVIPNVIVGLMATFGGQKDFYCEDCHYTWPREGTKLSAVRPNSAPYYFIEGMEQTRTGQQAAAQTPH